MNDKKSSTGANGGGQATAERQFLLQQLYVKDLSFEAPNTPMVFSGQAGEPDVQMNLKNSHNRLDDNRFEVVLHINVHARLDDRSVFLVEIDQAGVFFIKGYGDDEIRRLLGIFCPNTLFPYAREAVSSIVSKGGFPPLVLQPINFDALYAQAEQKKSAAG